MIYADEPTTDLHGEYEKADLAQLSDDVIENLL
jgi:hypothetical protein